MDGAVRMDGTVTMDQAEIRIWAANKALVIHGALTLDAEKTAERLFAFAALGAFDVPYLLGKHFGEPVTPVMPSRMSDSSGEWMAR